MGRGCVGGGQVVSMLTFHSDNPSSNPIDTCRFFLFNFCLKRPKINKKETGVGPFKRTVCALKLLITEFEPGSSDNFATSVAHKSCTFVDKK